MSHLKESKLEFYFKNFQSNLDFKEFYNTSFNTQRNKKTKYILENYSFLLSENNFISDRIQAENRKLSL